MANNQLIKFCCFSKSSRSTGRWNSWQNKFMRLPWVHWVHLPCAAYRPLRALDGLVKKVQIVVYNKNPNFHKRVSMQATRRIILLNAGSTW